MGRRRHIDLWGKATYCGSFGIDSQSCGQIDMKVEKTTEYPIDCDCQIDRQTICQTDILTESQTVRYTGSRIVRWIEKSTMDCLTDYLTIRPSEVERKRESK